jgi:DNA helicase-2/ATP-dependent DNA helicase PcrA
MTTDGDSPPGQVVIQAYLDPEGEARAVARALREAGPPWGQQAVLARTNKTLDLVEAALLEAQIPCYRTQDILKRPEVRWVLRELKQLAAQRLARSARSDLQEIAAEVLAYYNRERADDELFHDDDDVALSTASPDCGTLELKLIQHHLDELRDFLEEYVAANSSGTLDGFFFWLKASTQEPTATRAPKGTVDLRTVHRAKGLEWQTVYLVGCTADLLPLEYSGDEAEERRLMFVAVTRASDKLVCTWSMNGRDRRGRQVRRDRSPYLTMIEAGVSAVASQEDRFSTTALSDLAAETIGQARAFLAGADRNTPPPLTRGRQPAAPSLMDVACRDRTEFNEDRALSDIAAHLGTSVGELRARMEVDKALAAQARLALASAKHLFTPPKRDEERHP